MSTRTEEQFDLVNVLGRRLRERRRELGLTLAEVATAADISIGHSSAIEKGTTLPSLPVLARLAHALDLTLADVLRAPPGPRIEHGNIDPQQGATRLVGSSSPIQIAFEREDAGRSYGAPFRLGDDDLFVFVHDGAIQIEVNDDRHELAAGDSIHCHAPRTVSWRAVDGSAGTLWVARAARARERLLEA